MERGEGAQRMYVELTPTSRRARRVAQHDVLLTPHDTFKMGQGLEH